MKTSNCCGAVALELSEEIGRCPKCQEHCEWELRLNCKEVTDDFILIDNTADYYGRYYIAICNNNSFKSVLLSISQIEQLKNFLNQFK